MLRCVPYKRGNIKPKNWNVFKEINKCADLLQLLRFMRICRTAEEVRHRQIYLHVDSILRVLKLSFGNRKA